MSFVQADFLPFFFVVLTAFVFAPQRARKLLLLLASLGFYAYSTPIYTVLLLISAALDFAVGRGLAGTEDERSRRIWLTCSLVGNLGLLAVFKYADLFVDLLNLVSNSSGSREPEFAGWALPLGISFYTFQTISYSFDVYRRKVEACKDPLEYLLYVSFFPQLVAGPIERANHLLPQLRNLVSPTLADLSIGVRLIAWGFLKKLVLADRLRYFAWPVFEDPEAYEPASLFLAAATMLVVLYLDFSAYTDIARGCARMFGIQLVRNFDRPFLATSIAELWGRWHMSLTSWIADYVYSPLARSVPTHLRIWRTNLIALGLFGLWHGASWKFLAWGLLNGALVAGYQSLRLLGWISARPKRQSFGRRLFDWSATMLASVFVIVVFFAPNFSSAATFVSGMIPRSLPTLEMPRTELLVGWGVLAVGFVFHSLGAWIDLEQLWKRATWLGRAAFLAVVIFLTLRYSLPSTREFIYFEF